MGTVRLEDLDGGTVKLRFGAHQKKEIYLGTQPNTGRMIAYVFREEDCERVLRIVNREERVITAIEELLKCLDPGQYPVTVYETTRLLDQMKADDTTAQEVPWDKQPPLYQLP
jgi:hypothetical protein